MHYPVPCLLLLLPLLLISVRAQDFIIYTNESNNVYSPPQQATGNPIELQFRRPPSLIRLPFTESSLDMTTWFMIFCGVASVFLIIILLYCWLAPPPTEEAAQRTCSGRAKNASSSGAAPQSQPQAGKLPEETHVHLNIIITTADDKSKEQKKMTTPTSPVTKERNSHTSRRVGKKMLLLDTTVQGGAITHKPASQLIPPSVPNDPMVSLKTNPDSVVPTKQKKKQKKLVKRESSKKKTKKKSKPKEASPSDANDGRLKTRIFAPISKSRGKKSRSVAQSSSAAPAATTSRAISKRAKRKGPTSRSDKSSKGKLRSKKSASKRSKRKSNSGKRQQGVNSISAPSRGNAKKSKMTKSCNKKSSRRSKWPHHYKQIKHSFFIRNWFWIFH